MEHLTKQQIVLLTLLVTFVTSIATGIVTVTLLEKAPPGVTQVINRVVEHTVEKIVSTPAGKATIVTEQVIVKEEELIVKAIDQNIKSMVVWRGTSLNGDEVHAGIGFIVSSSGLAVADKSTISWVPRDSLFAIYGGKKLPVEIVFEKPEVNFVIIKILQPKAPLKTTESNATTSESAIKDLAVTFAPVLLADSNQLKLGQATVFLSGKKGTSVSTGIISELISETTINDETKKEESRLKSIKTTVRLNPDSAGAPLITLEGSIAAIMVSDSIGFASDAVPINDIKNAITNISSTKKEESEI